MSYTVRYNQRNEKPLATRRVPQGMAGPSQGTQSFRSQLTPLTYIRVGHNVDDGFSLRPKGGPHRTQSCVTALVKGTTIACMDAGKGREQDAASFDCMDAGKGREQDAASFDCELCLDLSSVWASDYVEQYRTLH